MDTLKKTSKKQAIKDSVRKLIKKQNLKPGDQILSQNQLAKKFKVNPLTAFRALSELCEENVLYRENGSGTFVGTRPKQRKNIALLLPGEHLANPAENPDYWPFVSHLTKVFMKAIGRNGIFSTISISERDITTFDLDCLRQYDLVFSMGLDNFHEFAKKLLAENVSCPVIFESPKKGVDTIYIDNDRKGLVKLGVSELLIRGYRRIGLFYMDTPWAIEDVEGYKEALGDFDVPIDDGLIFKGFSLQKDGVRAASILMARGMPCDAVFTDTDLLGLGMVEHFNSKGVRIPEEIGIMGYHGLNIATEQTPYLSSARVPYQEMIAWAFQTHKDMKGKITLASKLDFMGEIIQGKTIKQVS